jgi:hypothetical protein
LDDWEMVKMAGQTWRGFEYPRRERREEKCPECDRELSLKQVNAIFDRWIQYCSWCGWEEV